MIPACRDEISTCPAEADFTLRLHVEIKFRTGKVGQYSTWLLIRFACIFFGIFFVSMSFYKCGDSYISIDLIFFLLKLFNLQLCLFFLIKTKQSLANVLQNRFLKNFAVFTGNHQRCSLLLIKLQTRKPAKGLQHRCFPVNIAKFLTRPILQCTSGGCYSNMMKFYKDIC